jgi:adenine-specific DNA-methyltransferase
MNNEAIDPAGIDQSPDPAAQRRAQLAALIPEAFSEGQLDVSALKRALGGEALIEGGERYALTWAGKANAYKVLQTPSRATLRPQRDLSVNFDEAQHVFTEGENLEVLKVLQKAYFGKVKLIYIDPPYNTGSDSFIYPDRFQESKEDYLRRINDLSDDGTLMREGFFRKNSKESGHYHSNWLSMMLPRLYIARNLLREDGVIFVSCDDNEVHNLRLLMNEVFGEENFIGSLIWKSRHNVDSRNKTGISSDHEYVLVFGQRLSGKEIDEDKYANPDNDPRGAWMSDNMVGLATVDQRPNLHYALTNPASGLTYVCPEKGWRYNKLTMAKKIAEGRVLWPSSPDGRPRHKKFLNEVKSRFTGFSTILSAPTTAVGTQNIRVLFGFAAFDFPKPYELILELVRQGDGEDCLVVDFFAGSSPTAQAVLELNASDGGNRKCISVQLPESTEKGSEAFNAGFLTIADIGRERIRQVLRKMESATDLATLPSEALGFKSFLLAPSNFKQWRGDGIDTPEQLAEQMLMFAKSEKEGAAVEHMLYELLLKFGQELTTPVEKLDVAGGKVFAIHDRKMLFVLESFTDAMIQPLVDMKPREIIAIDGVFLDSDPLKSNLDLQCRDAGIKFTCL